jgi:hypothetical protein
MDKQTRLVGSLKERQSFIVNRGFITISFSIGMVLLFYIYVPSVRVTDRLAFACQWNLIALLPYIANCLVIMGERLLGGAHNPLLGQESDRLKIHCRTMQNTLEQFIIFAFGSLALVTLLPLESLRLIPILAVGFVCARLIFWNGYLNPSNCLARAPGVQITLAINLGITILALSLMIKHFL